MLAPTIQLPPLHRGQLPVANSLARFRVVCAGRRWGKTRLGVLECLRVALAGGRAWWVAPTYAIGGIGWRVLTGLTRQIPGTVIREGDRTVRYGAGAVVVKSSDSPDGLRGEGLDLVVVDEAAHTIRWEQVWAQVLRPALSDRQGRALFISTPHGFNHFYELYQEAQRGGEWAAWQQPTSASPFIDPAEIEAARQLLPALVFRQEYGAEFVQLAGALFRREYFTHILDAAPPGRSVRAWDLAASTKTMADYTVGARVTWAADGTLVITDVVRGRWEWPQAIRVIGSTALGDGPGVGQYVEDVGIQKGMLQLLLHEPDLRSIAFRSATPQGDKIQRAGAWLARAEQGKVALVRGAWNAAFLDEVCGFPESEHDDQVDAVSAAVVAGGTGQVLLAWG